MTQPHKEFVPASVAGLVLLALLVVGFAVRSYGVFDGVNNWMHPDENRMVMAMRDVQLPSTERLVREFSIPPSDAFWAEFDKLNPHFFAYGSLTIYLYRFSQHFSQDLGRSLAWSFRDVDNSFILVRPFLRGLRSLFATMSGSYDVGRLWTLIFGTLTILLTYRIARTMTDRGTALLAAGFLTFAVLHVQLSRFLTSDVILVFFLMASLLKMLHLSGRGRVQDYLLAGVLIGASVATKLNGVMLLAPLLLAHVIWAVRTKNVTTPQGLIRWALLPTAVLIAVVTFVVIEPFAVLDFTEFWRQTKEESDKVRGVGFPPPYMIQFFETPRFIFQLEQMITWGLGLPLGLLAVAGVLSSLFLLQLQFRHERMFLLAYVLLYYALVGNLQVKWMRHMLPVYPPLCIFAALLLRDIWGHRGAPKWRRQVAGGLGGFVAVASVLYTGAFLDVYRNPNTRTKASIWIYENVPAGSKVLGEHWDEGLPTSVRNMPGKHPGIYTRQTLENYESSSPPRMQKLAERLAWADYYFINSKRLYHSVPRDPRDTHKKRGTFYRLLFMEELGYELIKTVTSYPSIFGFELINDLAEESFTVYDHPKASIFRNVGRLSEDEILRRIDNPPPEVEEMTIPRMLLATENGIPDSPFLGSLSFAFVSEEEQQEKRRIRAREVDTTDIVKKQETKRKGDPFHGGRGSDFGQFVEPRDIALIDEHMYVVDMRNYRIQKFTRDGTFVSAFGQQGTKFRQFEDPLGIGIDNQGNLVVVDTWNQRLQKFDPDGKFLDTFPEGVTLFAPTDIDFDGDGNMYLSDSGNSRILKLNPEGRVIGEFGMPGEDENGLKEPRGVWVDDANRLLYICDGGNRRVKVYSLDGVVQDIWQLPTEPAGDARPWFITGAPDGRLYVSEPLNNQVFAYSKDGRLEARLTVPVSQPFGLAAGQSHLYIVEYGPCRIRKVTYDDFEPIAPKATTPGIPQAEVTTLPENRTEEPQSPSAAPEAAATP